MTAIAPYLSTFLREHLPRERRASPHTCEAYAYAFQLLLCFAAHRLNTNPSSLELEQIDAPLVLAFLEHLEHERGNSPKTRNARLAAVLVSVTVTVAPLTAEPSGAVTVPRMVEVVSCANPATDKVSNAAVARQVRQIPENAW